MKKNRTVLGSALAGAALALLAGAAQAELIGGVEFPDGAESFADGVASYAPPVPGPSDPHQGSGNSLGIPNYAGVNGCASPASCSFVSLGDGGTLIVEFVDNRLTGSGSAALDLWIFEVGPDVEDTFVSISKDGVTYHDVGKVLGSTRGIDIDVFGWGHRRPVPLRQADATTRTRAARAAAVPPSAPTSMPSARSPRSPRVPEPETWAMFMLGALAIGLQRRRAAKTAKTAKAAA